MSRHTRLPRTFLLIALIVLQACYKSTPRNSNQADSTGRPQNAFDNYLNSDIPPADGFDFAVGDANGKAYRDRTSGKQFEGWYIATQFAEVYSLGIHTGEDWNGNGGGNTDLGQEVHAVANGRVTFAEHCGRLWGNVVMVQHNYYENQAKRKVISLYAHLLEMKVVRGEAVRRGQIIATVGQDPDKLFNAHLHLELRWDESLAPTYWPSSNGKDQAWVREHYTAPSEFINGHRNLPVPQRERTLLLVDHDGYKARLYDGGVMRGEYDVSFGQGKGQKLVEGDNKTPKGMYFVTQKHRGQFDGPYGAYYGGHWIKINYPNRYDAIRGVADKVISREQAATITAAWQKRAPTLQDTKLGGGIGFHGWNKEWDNEGPRHLSWGCVVMHLSDIRKMYDSVPEGAMVVIF